MGVVLYAYAVLLGAAYLLAFWRPFGFDIFPFVSPRLLVTLPLNRLSVLLAPLVLAGLLLFLNWGSLSRIPRVLFGGIVVAHLWPVASNYLDAVARFRATEALYENEKSILALVPFLAVVAAAIAVQAFREKRPLRFQIASVALLQLGAALAAGYADGKALYVGAYPAFFLENAAACEEHPVRDWVYLGKFDTQTIFMNTIEKRMCVLQNAQYTLVPRQLADKRESP
jgi:hypothetical protein